MVQIRNRNRNRNLSKVGTVTVIFQSRKRNQNHKKWLRFHNAAYYSLIYIRYLPIFTTDLNMTAQDGEEFAGFAAPYSDALVKGG
jgi:hypothetical protein